MHKSNGLTALVDLLNKRKKGHRLKNRKKSPQSTFDLQKKLSHWKWEKTLNPFRDNVTHMLLDG